MDDILVNFGGEVKAVEETSDGWKIGGYLVVFESHDVSSMRDKFTKSTDYDIENGDKCTLYYHHGLDGTFQKTKLGTGTLSIKDDGVWFSGVLKRRGDYLKKHVERMAEGIKNGVFGLSSGVPAHLVEREPVEGGHVIKMWPLGKDASITECPAEPLTSCVSLKALVDLEEAAEELKKYDARQPRDDHGRWTDGAGKLSVGHALHVMKHEGISDEKHHAAVREAIESGKHKSREDVLKHIDSIHATNGKGEAGQGAAKPKPLHEMTNDERAAEFEKGRQELAKTHPHWADNWEAPKGSIYADVPNAGNNKLTNGGDANAQTLVHRLNAYERAYIEEQHKNPEMLEGGLHHRALMASGLTEDGLLKARVLTDKKASFKPGVFFPISTYGDRPMVVHGLAEATQGTATPAASSAASDKPATLSEPDRVAHKVAEKMLASVAHHKPGTGTVLSIAPEGFENKYYAMEESERVAVVKNLASRGLLPEWMGRKKTAIRGFEVVQAMESTVKQLAEKHQFNSANQGKPFSESPIFQRALEHPKAKASRKSGDDELDESTEQDETKTTNSGGMKFCEHLALVRDDVQKVTGRIIDYGAGYEEAKATKSGQVKPLPEATEAMLQDTLDAVHDCATEIKHILGAFGRDLDETAHSYENEANEAGNGSQAATKALERGWAAYVERTLAQTGISL